MAEQEPTFAPVLKDERDTVAAMQKQLEKAQRQLENAQFDATQKEAFGKFDVTVPQENEVNYMEYIESRPSNGIVRNGDVLQDTETGKFAGIGAYEAQNGNAQEHYDKVGNIDNKGEFERPNYEEMHFMQLIKEAGKARLLGDTLEENDIREVAQRHITEWVMESSEDKESAEAAQARFDEELAHYEKQVARYAELADKRMQEVIQKKNDHHGTQGEGDPSSRASDESRTEVAAPAENTQEAATAQSDTSAKSEAAEAIEAKAEEVPTEPGAYYKGKKLRASTGVVTNGENGEGELVEVIDVDGNVQTVKASEIVYVGKPAVETALETAKEDKVETLVVDTVSDNEVAIEPTEKDDVDNLHDIIEDQNKEPGKELEVYKAKKWWQKVGDFVRPRAGIAYWAAQWDTYVSSPVREGWSKWLEYGVTDEMNDDEKERRRKDNRVVAIVAGAGLAVIGATIIAGSQGWLTFDSGSELPNGGSTGGGTGAENGADAGADLGNGQGSGGEGVNVIPIDGNPGAENLTDGAAIEISAGDGEGGESLFARHGVDAARWYEQAPSLLNQFPQDFYQEGNDIRIAHSGPLSQGAQDYINSLR